MNHTVKPLLADELNQAGVRALVKELGAKNALQFLLGHRKGRGDYTKERRAWVDSVTLEELVEQVNQIQGTKLRVPTEPTSKSAPRRSKVKA